MSISKESFNGKWVIDEIPKEFMDILRVLGYNSFERKYFQKNKLVVNCILKGDQLSLNVKSTFFTHNKDYTLNGMPNEVEIEGSQVMEIARWLDPSTIQIKTIFLAQNVTIIETRQLLTKDQCEAHYCALHSGDDHPIEVVMIYNRVPE
jgi:hypothetical protein